MFCVREGGGGGQRPTFHAREGGGGGQRPTFRVREGGGDKVKSHNKTNACTPTVRMYHKTKHTPTSYQVYWSYHHPCIH